MNIPIFFAFNDDYTIPACVAFYSLLEKSKKETFFEMHVLHSNINPQNQEKLKKIISKFKNASLDFINTQDYIEDLFDKGNFSKGCSGSVFTSDTLSRCFCSKFFPQYEKIIYSDVDVIFMDDISDLMNINMENKYFAGVKNPFAKWSSYELSHLNPKFREKINDNYIGGGILVLNLKKIREDNLEEKMLEVAQDNSIEKRWPDQDLINITSNGNITFIPLEYVSYPYMIELVKKPDFISCYSREEIFNSILNPKIIHFAASKPWNSEPNYSNLWWSYFKYLKLEKTRIFKDASKNNKLKKYKFLFKLFATTTIFLFLTLTIFISRSILNG